MAITLDVITKVVEGSLKDSSTTVEKHFARAGEQAGTGFSKSFSKSITNSTELQKTFDKAADSAGRLRVEQQKLNELQEKGVGGARLIAQQEKLAKVHRETERAVRDTTNAYQAADKSAGSMLSTLNNITAGTRLGGITSQATSLASSLSGVGLATGVAVGAFAALAVGAIAVGNKLYDMGKMWDNVSDNITAKTGKVGDELQAVVDQVVAVGNTTAATHEELGAIAAQAVQSLRLSGDQLGSMMKQLAELNNLTGEQTNVRGLGMIFRMFGVDAKDQVPFLNDLYSTFQKMGIPVNDLIATLDKGGTVLAGFGMSATQAAATIALFEQAGVPADQALRGLTAAFKNLNAAGKDPSQGLRDMVTQIKALHDAGNDLGTGGARDMAEQYFGKGFGPMLQAIIEGRLEIDKLPTSVGQTKDSIDTATKATEDFSEKWRVLSNNFASVVKPAATGFFDWMNDQLINITEVMVDIPRRFAEEWHNLKNSNWWQDSGLGRILSGLGFAPDQDYSYGGNFGPTDAAPGSAGTSAGGTGTGAGRTGSNQGLTPNSINAKGAIESAFPDVSSIGGYRPPDVTPNGTFTEHSSGQAIDVMVPNWSTPQGKSYGDQIKQYALARPDVDYVLWQQTQWNSDGTTSPMTDRGSPTQNHMDHVHVHTRKGTTTGSSNGPHGAAGSATNPLPGQAGNSTAGSPVGPTSGPGGGGPASAPVSPSTADFPSADAVGPASATTTPVQMVPSPFGPQYAPVPAGSTPGYNNSGAAGTFLPDPERVKGATKQYENALGNIATADETIAEAKARQAEIEQDITSDSKKRADAQKNVNEAEKRRNQLIDDAAEAQDNLAQAKLGTFREAQKAQAAKSGKLGDVGASLADDFGLSEGLPGIAKWFTTFLANAAFAPMIGQLSAISAVSPYQGGSGMFGMLGAQNMSQGLSPLGLSSGSSLGSSLGSMLAPSMGAAPVGPASMGPAPIGGGLGDMVPGLGGPVGPAAAGGGAGPATTPPTQMSSLAPTANPDGGGLGLGGLPMAGIQAATAGLSAVAPGMGQAAQMGVQLANRTAQFAGQLAGIGVGGLMETFLPHGSPLADPGKSWLGKLAGGLAGARPATPNAAGGGEGGQAGQSAPPQTPEQAAALQGQNGGGQSNGPMVHVENMNNYTPDGGQSVANQVGRLQMSSYAAGGPR